MRRTFRAHQFNRQSEQPARLVAYHFEVVVFRGTGQSISPEEIHALPAMQIEEFFGIDLNDHGIVESQKLLECAEVDVIGTVDRLRSAKDGVGHRNTAAQLGVVLDIINQKGGGMEQRNDPRDDGQRRSGHQEPFVEGIDELCSDVLARMRLEVGVGPFQDVLLLLTPAAATAIDQIGSNVGGW